MKKQWLGAESISHPFLWLAFNAPPVLRFPSVSNRSIEEIMADDDLCPLIPGERCPDPYGIGPKFTIRTVEESKGTRCSDLEYAEKLALDRFLAIPTQSQGGNGTFDDIYRATTDIAFKTRSSRGNTALMHPETLFRLLVQTNLLSVSCMEHCKEPRQAFGWREHHDCGFPLSRIEITPWIKPTVPPGKIIVLKAGLEIKSRVAVIMGTETRPTLCWNDLGKYGPEDFVRVVDV